MPWLKWLGALIVSVAVLVPKQSGAFQAPPAETSGPQSDQKPQLIPRTHEQREQRFVAQHRIILNVQVADSSGKPYTDLKKPDFTLYDNDQERKLVAVSSVNGDSAIASPHVILVLDTVNNFSRSLRSYEKDVEAFLKDGEGPLAIPISIGVFSGVTVEAGHPSRDRDALLADLHARAADLHATGCLTVQDQGQEMKPQTFGGGAAGGYRAETTQMLNCLNQRFVSSVTALHMVAQSQVDVPGRVILIWIGPGWPLLTNRSFTPDPPEVKQNFFERLVTLSTALREAQVTIDAVASPEDLPYPQAPVDSTFFDGVSTEDQVKAGHLGLHALAHQTGGRILTDRADLPGQIRTCMADAESYYVLTFDSAPAPAFGEYHSLAVKVDKPGLEVRTNTLYYAEQ